MLTKTDLSQIRKIIREEVENEVRAVKEELQSDITMSRIRVQNDLDELKDRVKNIEIRITILEGKVSKMHKELKREIKMISHFLDKENMKTLTRVQKIEKHLGLSVS